MDEDNVATRVEEVIDLHETTNRDDNEDWVLPQTHEQGLVQESDSEEVSLGNNNKKITRKWMTTNPK